MVNIVDVAKLAGVSAATVSRYLDGARVRQASRIQTVIDETGFRRNASASGLRKGKHNSVGIVMPDIANPLLAEIITGAERVLAEHGIHVLLGNSDEDAEREKSLIKDLVTRTDGLIVFPVLEQSSAAKPARPDIPTVLIDRDGYPGQNHDLITVDNIGGARQAVAHLAEQGHRDIAIIAGPTSTTPGRQRLEGFHAEMAARGLPVPASAIIAGDFRESGGEAGAHHIAAAKTRPTAVFVANNLMTIGFLRAARHLHLEIPTDISVLGFDDLALAELITPALTVITRPTFTQGEMAAHCLLQRMQMLAASPAKMSSASTTETLPRHQIVLPVELLIRESVRKI